MDKLICFIVFFTILIVVCVMIFGCITINLPTKTSQPEKIFDDENLSLTNMWFDGDLSNDTNSMCFIK